MWDRPSNNRLKAIGNSLAAGNTTLEDEELLGELLRHCDTVQVELADLLISGLERHRYAGSAGFKVRGRAKSRVTLEEKLRRMGGDRLPTIRDLADVRVVGSMLLSEQDEVMHDCCSILGVRNPRIIDRRSDPRSGYRALHVEFEHASVRVELQLRTVFQHLWAEIYEKLGDTFGREIRYLESSVTPMPATTAAVIDSMQQLSDAITKTEDARQVVEHAEATVRATLDRMQEIQRLMSAAGGTS